MTALQPEVKHLTTFVRNPTWITAGFAQKYAGPNGTNFKYTEEQKKEFSDPKKFLAYRKELETQLSLRFPMLHKDSPEQAEAVRFSKEEMTRRLGGNKELIDQIIPKTFGVGCRFVLLN